MFLQKKNQQSKKSKSVDIIKKIILESKVIVLFFLHASLPKPGFHDPVQH